MAVHAVPKASPDTLPELATSLIPFAPLSRRSISRESVEGYCPADTPLQRLAELAHSRWPIEQFYEDAKGECGLGDYQGRRWDGLHRHLALVMLAYSFLARQRWTPAGSAGFSPLTGAPIVSGRPSLSSDVAFPGCGVMAHCNAPDYPFPSQTDLTK
jgi:hypothetical protein